MAKKEERLSWISSRLGVTGSGRNLVRDLLLILAIVGCPHLALAQWRDPYRDPNQEQSAIDAEISLQENDLGVGATGLHGRRHP